MNPPNLFIVGAARSGTTSLWHCLKEHPQLFMAPVKEPAFFSELKRTRFKQIDRYLTMFEEASEKQRWIGEASTAYLTDPASAQKIREYTPEARIIIMLRNPALRAYSLYNWMAQSGYEYAETFEEALNLEYTRMHKDIPNYFESEYYYNYLYFHSGLYYVQVQRYIELFKEHVLIIKFEDYRKDFPGEYAKVCSFLDITPLEPSNPPRNASQSVYAPVIQFVLRKLTKFYFSHQESIEENLHNRRIVKQVLLRQVQEDLTTLSTKQSISFLKRWRLYYLLHNITQKLHSKILVLNKNTLYERDGFMRFGYRNTPLKKMNPATDHNLMNHYQPDVSKLSALTGIEFSAWGM